MKFFSFLTGLPLTKQMKFQYFKQRKPNHLSQPLPFSFVPKIVQLPKAHPELTSTNKTSHSMSSLWLELFKQGKSLELSFSAESKQSFSKMHFWGLLFSVGLLWAYGQPSVYAMQKEEEDSGPSSKRHKGEPETHRETDPPLGPFSLAILEKELKLNRYVLDLRAYQLSAEDLQKLYNALETELTIGRIRWRSDQIKMGALFNKIESLLEKHREEYIDRPLPFVYAKLSELAYRNDGGKGHEPAGWQVLKTSELHSDAEGYFGVAYENKALRHIIVAHRGTEPNQMHELILDLQQDMGGVVRTRISKHEAHAVAFAEEIKLNDVLGKGYQLSFTGHSLGGWLAQICVYQAKKKNKNDDSFAIVLDSPGAREHLQRCEPHVVNESGLDLNKLDITVYLSYPNPVNTCHSHLGTQYALSPKLPPIVNRWGKTERSELEYVSQSHDKTNLVACFDEKTGFPVQAYRVIDWPQGDWQRSRHDQGFFGNAVHLLYDYLVNNITEEYQGARKLRGDFTQQKSLSFDETYFLKNAYHYDINPIDPCKIDCRHLPKAMYDFLKAYQTKGQRVSLESIPFLQVLGILPQLKPLLKYQIIQSGSQEKVEMLEIKTDKDIKSLTNDARSFPINTYCQQLSKLLNYYNELRYLDYDNYLQQQQQEHVEALLTQKQHLHSVEQAINKQRQANNQLLSQLAGLQTQARLYLYGEATDNERTEVEQQRKQIQLRLEDNQQLYGQLTSLLSKHTSKQDFQDTIQALSKELKQQQQQLHLAQAMSEALEHQRFRRFQKASLTVQDTLQQLEQFTPEQKAELFTSSFSETQLKASLYNLQAKLGRVSLPLTQWNKVLNSYQHAIDTVLNTQPVPVNATSTLATLYSSKGALLNDWGRHEEAIKAHAKAQELDEYQSIVLSNLAWGQYQLAKQKGTLLQEAPRINLIYEKSLQKASYLAGTWYYRALFKKDLASLTSDTFKKQKLTEEAESDFKQALNIQPEHPKALYYRAQFYIDQGKKTEALEDIEKAKIYLRLEIPDHQEQLQLLEVLAKQIPEQPKPLGFYH